MKTMITVVSLAELICLWLSMVHGNRIHSTGYHVVLCLIITITGAKFKIEEINNYKVIVKGNIKEIIFSMKE